MLTQPRKRKLAGLTVVKPASSFLVDSTARGREPTTTLFVTATRNFLYRFYREFDVLRRVEWTSRKTNRAAR